MNPIQLSLFASRISAICTEMGTQLQCAAFSPNIRDRLDFSCAIFDAKGALSAQAAHIPVHLGSMAYAMQDIVNAMQWQDGDMVVLNDPYKGGTHLPDVTVIAPCYVQGQLIGFVANRAHHADIGAKTPGSMPISAHLEEEGLLIAPTYLYRGGKRDEQQWQVMLNAARNPVDSAGDFSAQISANQRGIERLCALIQPMGQAEYSKALAALNDYGQRLAQHSLAQIPDGKYRFQDWMDDDGQGQKDIPIQVAIQCDGGTITVDFQGTAQQVKGNINCPVSVAAAAVFYVFRCLMPPQTPLCEGSFRNLKILAPKGCLLNAIYPAAVAAGNVETSTRIVDVMIGALKNALPERMPAASHGSMNNLALGSKGLDAAWDYYETIGGGMGASCGRAGLAAVQTHMTNTLNTPIEVLEQRYPLRVTEYSIRCGSGGKGESKGGDGIVREFELLSPACGTVISERRLHRPWGLAGGQPGQPGYNDLNGRPMPGKAFFELKAGDRLRLETPGGGGFGKP